MTATEEKKKKAKKAAKASKSTDQTKSNSCYVCHKSSEDTPKFMLSCKTCGLKIHADCYENQHLSLKFADSWECVECKKCEVCKDAEYKEGNEILMCNRCDKGYHQLCCSEKFRNVPEGDKPWFCESCYDYLKDKKQKKKRKTEKIVTKSESSESLFKLKPNKLQKLEESKPTLPISPITTTSTTNGTTATQPTTTTPTTTSTTTTSTAVASAAVTNGISNNKEVVQKESSVSKTPTTNGHNKQKKEQHVQTEGIKDRISVFLVFRVQTNVFYSCTCPFPAMDGPHIENRSVWSDKYFKHMIHIISKRLEAKVEDMKEDERTNSETKKKLNENSIVIERVALKEKDRFNCDLHVDLDRIYFEDYELRSGDTLIVDMSFEQAPNSSTTTIIRWDASRTFSQ